jgi:hypothetical protein
MSASSSILCCSSQAKKRARGAVIGLTRVAVADGGGEEFEEAANGVIAGAGDHGRDDDVAGDRDGGPSSLGRYEIVMQLV